MKINYEEMFPDTSKEILNLLSDLLQFNPGFRPTAKECLQKPLFDQIRDPLLNKTKPEQFFQEIY